VVTFIRWLIALGLATGIASGQPRANVRARVLTVCEVLADIDSYANHAVAIVGRMERSVSLIDHYEFLSQDRCDHPVITHGHAWSDRIQIWTGWETGMPTPPSDVLKLEQSALAAKLRVVRQTTSLGSHLEPQFKSDGHSIVFTHSAATPN
jgi:hypothetical protein